MPEELILFQMHEAEKAMLGSDLMITDLDPDCSSLDGSLSSITSTSTISFASRPLPKHPRAISAPDGPDFEGPESRSEIECVSDRELLVAKELDQKKRLDAAHNVQGAGAVMPLCEGRLRSLGVTPEIVFSVE